MNDFDGVVDRVGNGYRLCVLGDPNGWVRDRLRVGISGGFGVRGENYNCRGLIDFCAETGVSLSNTYFKPMNFHKYNRVARGEEWR